jgi:hypothetical protein
MKVIALGCHTALKEPVRFFDIGRTGLNLFIYLILAIIWFAMMDGV